MASTLMLGSTIGLAAAANYPSPFVSGGSPNVGIVFGSNAAVTDLVAAINIMDNLRLSVTGTDSSNSESSVEGGDAVILNSGSDYIYLNDELNENVQTLTNDDLSTILADGTFTDNDGTNYKYEQTLTVGPGASFAFDNSDNDLDDPALIISLPTSTSNVLYNLTVTFDNAVNFTATDSIGEEIELFGKTYSIGSSTDLNTLVLLGGSASQIIEIGETKTIVAGDKSYEVTLTGISDATSSPEAGISIDGESKVFTEGQTRSFNGGDLDVYVKDVFRTGENSGYVEIQLGADKLTLENGNAVQYGNDDDDIEGTLVTLTGATTATTKMVFSVAAEDNDVNHLLVGEEFMDPIFRSLKVNFNKVSNGPILSGHDDTSTERGYVAIEKGGNRELSLKVLGETLPFTYKGEITDDSENAIHIVEGETLLDNSYFILNSGNYHHFMEMTKVDADSSGQVTFKDLISGESYGTTSGTNHSAVQTVTISNQVYTITAVNSSSVTITSSDFATNIAVYPYLELVSDGDHRVAITDYVTVFNDATDESDKTLVLPTGTAVVTFTNLTAGDCTLAVDTDTKDVSLEVNSSAISATGINDTFTTGTVDYFIWANETGTSDGGCTAIDVKIGIESTQNVSADVPYDAPALLFVEDEDKSEDITTTKNAILLKTSDDGTYTTTLAPVFTGTSDTETFDNSDYTGYLTNFGTYVLFDSNDANQDFASWTYPKLPMRADVYIAESSATVTGGSTTTGGSGTLVGVPITDSEISSASGQNLIVVGGSCINSVAADLLDSASPLCGADFTSVTGVSSGQFLIETFARDGGTVATLVAGYNAGDTKNAATYLRTLGSTNIGTSVGMRYVGTSSTSAELITETA